MTRLLLLLAGVACVACHAAPAQRPPRVNEIFLEPRAAHILDSLANDARTHRIENAGCVTGYTIADTVLRVTAIGPAHYAHADSVSIHADSTGDICQLGQPTIHTHVAWGGESPPSERDQMTGENRGFWSMLLQVYPNGYRIFLY
jgi:hypothetical protein